MNQLLSMCKSREVELEPADIIKLRRILIISKSRTEKLKLQEFENLDGVF